MSDNGERHAEYLAKALKAKAMAAKSKTLEARERWERMAEAYLGLAKFTLSDFTLQQGQTVSAVTV
jgi:hypothetical protein